MKCAEKLRFKSERAALAFAESSFIRFGTYQRVYRCNICRKFHLTSDLLKKKSK